jgi:hypothetical protein
VFCHTHPRELVLALKTKQKYHCAFSLIQTGFQGVLNGK